MKIPQHSTEIFLLPSMQAQADRPAAYYPSSTPYWETYVESNLFAAFF